MKRSFRMISQILIVLSDSEEILNSDSDEENKLLFLTKIGYSEVEVSIAMERCGPNSSITELTDFICAAQMAKAADTLLSVEDRKQLYNDPNYKQRRNSGYDFWKRKKQRKLEKKLLNEDDHVHLSNLMIGSAKLTEKIRKVLEACDDEPSSSVHKYILDECRKWNLISLKTIHEDLYRDMFHGGINVLSLFSGISDAKVAFYCLGISLKTDVQELNDDRLEQLMSRFNGLDLVVGGINNLLKDIMNIILTKKVIGIEEVAMMYQDLSQHHGITRVQVDFGKVGSFKLVQYVASTSTNLKKRFLYSYCKDASRFQNLRNVF
ncbi:DNA (Cytosine-5)-methyltransferase DRM1/2 isoform 4 [Hibiscus syriacus]|uniref:DNA (Cytosine-5)-methyltransferase DRM1/2 isoform 4 n=1 Tax=Hibiscus syriacus TaxID=106335 RepID=A0A6A3AE67_HIBSY|nr:DNA (Cytosine-5)-methyltransferase DRM1/2 isoform 4 [Hibiscus syriacus]